MSNTITEVFLAGEDKAVEKDGLVWKTILRTGEWKVHPNGKGHPLKFAKDGTISDKEIPLSEIKKAFDDQAIENVTIPLSHENKALENTGYIRKLEIVDGSDGISRLVAGHEFTEPEAKQKALNGSIPGTSAGLLFNYQRKSDGKTFPVALGHSCLTPMPWIDGMEPFGLSASDEIDVIETLEPVEEEVTSDADPPGAVVEPEVEETVGEKETTGLNSYIKKIDEYFKDLAQSWTKTPEAAKPVEDNSVEPPAQRTQDEPQVIIHPFTSEQNSIEDQLREAQQRRQAQLSQERTRQRTTNGDISMTELNIDSLDLSDELKTALKARETQLAQREQELAELRKTARATEIESRVSELKTLGLEQHPGLLKYVKEVYESDDGGSALNLSQDGKTEAKTASEILDGFIALLPTKDDKIALSAQVAESDKDEKPAENTDKELSLEDRAKQAREFLGLADPTKK